MTAFTKGQDVNVVEYANGQLCNADRPAMGTVNEIDHANGLMCVAHVIGKLTVKRWFVLATGWRGDEHFGFRAVPLCGRCDKPVLEPGTDGLCIDCRGNEADRQWERAREG